MSQPENITDHTVAVFKTHDQAGEAIKALSTAGFNVRNLSILGQNYATEEHAVGYINTGDRMWSWGKMGAFWGWIWGLLFGSAAIFIPGAGLLMFAGYIVGAIETAALAGGIAAVAGAFTSIGTPKDSIVKYQTALTAGNYLVIAHGSDPEVARAKSLLESTSATSVESFASKQVALTK